jgi:arsenite methyltransferase
MEIGDPQPPQLRAKVRDAYSTAAQRPQGTHPFPVGRQFALEVGYPPEVLASLPQLSVDAFAGVSNISISADIPPGSTILDLGCGAGLDSLIAAHRTQPKGRVLGIDFSEAMIRRAKRSASEAGFRNVVFSLSDAERLPVRNESIDVALINGIFNLNPAREIIFRELARVMQPRGSVYVAELVLSDPLPAADQRSERNWFA